MEENVHATIAAANTAIVGWLNGDLPDTDAAFDSLRALCHPDLSIIQPSGTGRYSGTILDDLRIAHGANGDFRIATPRDHTRLLYEDSATVVAEFIELQAGAKAVDRPRHARRVTVIFLKDHAAPHGLLIWRLHESIMPPSEEATLDWSSLKEMG